MKNNTAAQMKRLEFQHSTMTDLRILAYFSLLAMEQKCILPKQVVSSYNAHLTHGHTYKLRKHILSEFVLCKED